MSSSYIIYGANVHTLAQKLNWLGGKKDIQDMFYHWECNKSLSSVTETNQSLFVNR